MGSGSENWDKYAEDYGKKVYSLTSTREKRKHIIDRLRDGQNVLIVGCGSTTYLQEEIILCKPGIHVTAIDYNPRMIERAKANCQSSRLKYGIANTAELHTIFSANSFDVVISTNSIIPENRFEVSTMYGDIFNVLKPGGHFLAFLPSYEAVKEITHSYPDLAPVCDDDETRICDTTGWQCFHTFDGIAKELLGAHFSSYEIEKIGIESPMEASQLRRIYNEKIGAKIWEHFIDAKKEDSKDPLPPHFEPTIKRPLENLCMEGYESKNIPPALIKRVSDYYRYIFNNNGHFLVFPRSFRFLSPQKVFGGREEDRVNLLEMDTLTEFPVDGTSGERAYFWHHPQITEEIIGKKISRDGHLTIIRDTEDNDIIGFTFGYLTTAWNMFIMEGWKNPLYYAGIELPELSRDFEGFLSTINLNNNGKPLEKDSLVYVWNCVAKEKKAKGLKILLELMKSHAALARYTSNIGEDVPVIGEATMGSTAYKFFKAVGFNDIPGALESIGKGREEFNSRLVMLDFERTTNGFNLPYEEVKKRLSNIT